MDTPGIFLAQPMDEATRNAQRALQHQASEPFGNEAPSWDVVGTAEVR